MTINKISHGLSNISSFSNEPVLPPQFWTIIMSFIILMLLVLFINIVMRKADPKKPPTTSQLLVTETWSGFSSFIDSLTGSRMKKAYPYLFVLFFFILATSFMSFFGWMPAATQPIFAITLGFITFIGIYVVGIATRGLLRFGKEKYKNPIEIFTQISPLLSISMRLFGATVATAVLFNLMTIILEGVGRTDFAAIWPAFNFFIKWATNMIDIFFMTIQAFVFVVLTTIYWRMELGDKYLNQERKKGKQKKKLDKKESSKLTKK